MKTAGTMTKSWNPIWRWLAAIGVCALTTVVGHNLSARPVAGLTDDACGQTAAAALASCKAAAESEYAVALGKCVNITDARAQQACKRQAETGRTDALDTCQGGFAVRQAACGKFGPGPYDPPIDPANFVRTVDNPYFPLVPGTTMVYKGRSEGDIITDYFAITHNTRVIDGVTCVEVHDSVYTNDVLSEDTLDWFAQDKNGNVWYFGENTAELENGLLATIAGSFLAGVNHDKPGIIMKAQPMVGDFYRQEFSLGNAEDNARTIGLNATVRVPIGTFEHCLKSEETTPLEPDALEDKFFAAGVGNVLTIDQVTGERDELVQITNEGKAVAGRREH